MSENKYLKLIQQQRNLSKSKKFNGSFLKYLELLESDPDIAQHAHKRLYKAICDHGIEKMEDSEIGRAHV